MNENHHSAEHPGRNVSIRISPEKTAVICGTIALLFLLANVVGYSLKYLPQGPPVKNFTLINLDYEANLPTYFSCLLLLSAGIFLGWIAAFKRLHQQPYVVHWALLSVIFVGMSIDEAASMHEKLIRPLRSSLNLTGFFYHAWVIPALVFVFGLLLFYARFLIHLRWKTKLIFIVAGVCYVTGVIGMEMVGGNLISQRGADNLQYGLLTVLEETLELVGAILFVYGLMDYFRFLDMQVQIESA